MEAMQVKFLIGVVVGAVVTMVVLRFAMAYDWKMRYIFLVSAACWIVTSIALVAVEHWVGF